MSPLAGFLVFIVSLTILVIVYLINQIQEENIIYLNNNQTKNKNSTIKALEKHKVFAETLNGRFAIIALMAAVSAYLTTGQIIPEFV